MFHQSKIIVSQNNNKSYLLNFLRLEAAGIELNTIESQEASIGIKDVSEVAEKISKRSDHLKVFMIIDANKLTLEAQNSLLKVIEEPTNNSLIILQTNNLDNLIETIKSRCTILYDEKDQVDNDQSNIDFIFKNFTQLSYLEKTKLVDKFLKDHSDKLSVKKAIIAILNEIATKQTFQADISKIEKAYKAVDNNVSSKLIFDLISITLSK